jgi:hypothetical protein
MKFVFPAFLFVSMICSISAQSPSFQSGQRVYVTASSLIVRSAPERKANRTGTITQGAAVQILE